MAAGLSWLGRRPEVTGVVLAGENIGTMSGFRAAVMSVGGAPGRAARGLASVPPADSRSAVRLPHAWPDARCARGCRASLPLSCSPLQTAATKLASAATSPTRRRGTCAQRENHRPALGLDSTENVSKVRLVRPYSMRTDRLVLHSGLPLVTLHAAQQHVRAAQAELVTPGIRLQQEGRR